MANVNLNVSSLVLCAVRHAIVEELAKFGAHVFTCARTQKDLDDTLSTWRAAGMCSNRGNRTHKSWCLLYPFLSPAEDPMERRADNWVRQIVNGQ